MMPSTTRARTPATIRISVTLSMFAPFFVHRRPSLRQPESLKVSRRLSSAEGRSQGTHHCYDRGPEDHHHQRRKDEKHQRRNHLDARLRTHFFCALTTFQAHVVGIDA